MSKCELTIEIDGGQREFEIGETVSGHLHVRVDSNCKCTALTLTQLWATHGRGNNASGGEQVLTLFSGEWRAGESKSYPFEFTIPPGPVSYHGHYLNVDHYLRAVADIPWAFDPKAEVDFLVRPAAKAAATRAGGPALPIEQSSALNNGFPTWVLWLFAFMFLLPGVGMAIGSGLAIARGEVEALVGLIFGVVFAAAGAFVLFLGMRNSLAEKKLGPVLAGVEPSWALPGDALALSLDFTPQAEVTINTITATLKGQESVVSGSGTNATTHTHVLYEQEVQLRSGAKLYAREPQELTQSVTLPSDAAPSFDADDNRLTWTVEFHVDIANWPDWTASVPVSVQAV